MRISLWPATLTLGAEYDDGLRQALARVLVEAGAVRLRHRWIVVGSQEIESWTYRVGRRRLKIEAETYRGLSIRGSRPLVERLAAAVQSISRVV